MSSRLKNKYLIKIILLSSVFFFFAIAIFFFITQRVWTQYDYKLIDFYYKQAVKYGYGPEPAFNPQIVYLTITDESYNYFGKNYLDRKDMARVSLALANLDPESVIYDILFVRESTPDADQQFLQSLERIGSVYLPTALSLSHSPVEFKWGKGQAYDQLRSNGFFPGGETGVSKPYHAKNALLQLNSFSQVAKGSGDINVIADADSVYRHSPILMKIDDFYYPSFSLAVFLSWANVNSGDIHIEWGKKIIVSATTDNSLDSDVVIPIDERGNVFVPFVNAMGNDFKVMTAHALLDYFSDENLRGNLLDFFEGNFVLIADIATGTSDLGDTPLKDRTPLVAMHASILNGLLTNTFYTPWAFRHVLLVLVGIYLLLLSAALLKSPWVLYGTGAALTVGIMVFTGSEFIHFRLFPVFTVELTTLTVFLGLIITLEGVMSKNRTFIKNTFAKYVPKEVVTELLNNPALVKLGGESRTATILFSDIVDFTSVSEKIAPDILVKLLNEYFSEMTDIILYQKGIIDKYIGDAIMAEFGIPLVIPNHADHAVTAALKMQQRLGELRKDWQKRGLPRLRCRMGINTGIMIVGNIGSKNGFDYTAIGDAVNLAARIEGANKRYGTSIIISQGTLESLTPGEFKIRILDFVKVKGKKRAVKIYEVYGFGTESLPLKDEEYYQLYDEGFNAYLVGNFSTAKDMFLKALSLHPGDPGSINLIHRMETLIANPIPHDWDGSVSLTVK